MADLFHFLFYRRMSDVWASIRCQNERSLAVMSM